MNPLMVSAQFAAYVWYTEVRQGKANDDEALRFAEQNGTTFLPSAHEGWGKLLKRMAKVRGARSVEGGRVRLRPVGRAQAEPLPEVAVAG